MGLQMLTTMRRMTKAFIMGTMEAVTAVVIFLSVLMRPNRRITRKARISWTSHVGTLVMPTSKSEMTTMKTSRWFQPLLRKRRSQCA